MPHKSRWMVAAGSLALMVAWSAAAEDAADGPPEMDGPPDVEIIGEGPPVSDEWEDPGTREHPPGVDPSLFDVAVGPPTCVERGERGSRTAPPGVDTAMLATGDGPPGATVASDADVKRRTTMRQRPPRVRRPFMPACPDE